MTALEFLKTNVKKGMLLPELAKVFEQMCSIPVGETDMQFFETGTFDFTDEEKFYFSLVRQYRKQDGDGNDDDNDDEYYQLHLDVLYPADEENRRFHGTTWNTDVEGDFFHCIRHSKAFKAVKDQLPYKVDVYLDET